MTFKFRGKKVTVLDDKLICDDDQTSDLLTPLFEVNTNEGPECGDPFLNLITRSFGEDSVTDFEDDVNMIY